MEGREKGRRREEGPQSTRLSVSSNVMLVFLPMCKRVIRSSSMSVTAWVSLEGGGLGAGVTCRYWKQEQCLYACMVGAGLRV